MGHQDVRIRSDSGLPFLASVAASNKYLLDQRGQPYIMLGDGQWTMTAALPSATDRARYWVDMAANGYNVIFLDVVNGSWKAGNISDDVAHYKARDGIYPFGGVNHDDITSLGAPYWARMDTVFDEAETHGFTVFFAIADGQTMTATLGNAGSTACNTYGQLLGNRYKTRPNLVWLLGEDYDAAAWGTYDPLMQQVMAGIRSAGDTHLMTAELNFNWSITHDDATWRPGQTEHYSIEWVYSYPPVYDQTRAAVAAADRPVMLGETAYINEHSSTFLTHRKEICWSLVTQGALAGFCGGNLYRWNILASGGPLGAWSQTDWDNSVYTNTTTDIAWGRIVAWFKTLTSWWLLAPDTAGTFLTGGAGTYVGTAGADNDASSYATAALASDGLLGTVYLPAARTLTVDTTKITNYVSSQWVDPSDPSHTLTPTTGGTAAARTYTHPGNNNAGDPDWLLVLRGA